MSYTALVVSRALVFRPPFGKVKHKQSLLLALTMDAYTHRVQARIDQRGSQVQTPRADADAHTLTCMHPACMFAYTRTSYIYIYIRSTKRRTLADDKEIDYIRCAAMGFMFELKKRKHKLELLSFTNRMNGNGTYAHAVCARVHTHTHTHTHTHSHRHLSVSEGRRNVAILAQAIAASD